MRKITLAEQLFAVTASMNALEKQAADLKAQLLKGMEDGEKVVIPTLGTILKVPQCQVLSIPPENAWELVKTKEEYFKFVKVQVSALKQAYGENSVVPLGTYETRSACLKVSLNNK